MKENIVRKRLDITLVVKEIKETSIESLLNMAKHNLEYMLGNWCEIHFIDEEDSLEGRVARLETLVEDKGKEDNYLDEIRYEGTD